MTGARALLWWGGVVTALAAGVARDSTAAHAAPRGVSHPCAAAWCTPTPPTAAESLAVAADADHLMTRYAGDPTPLGRRCYALGAAMHARAAADVRMVAYMWRAANADGNEGPVTGDAHPVELAAGLGRVHIARGFDALNPDRGLSAIVLTARHEFAHLTGARQGGEWAGDAAAQLATDCGGV